ncbi:MAG: hypothetical protein AMXMBFR83_29090, partial [Phycisphaerae bacterium]
SRPRISPRPSAGARAGGCWSVLPWKITTPNRTPNVSSNRSAAT